MSKPREEIITADIEALIDSRIQEGERIEFKRELPGSDGQPSQWMSGATRLEDRAKYSILKEVVAFANSYGGVLVLGMEEDSPNQSGVAKEICPIPNCEQLADRFRQIINELVEPQLLSCEVFAVAPDGSDEGVVLFRIPEKSRLAPHGLRTPGKKTYLCPIRRWDRSEAMPMREIQDMTLNVNRGIQRLDERLQERAERFKQEFNLLNTPRNAYGLRITAAPVAGDIRLAKVLGSHAQLVQGLNVPEVKVTRKDSDQVCSEVFGMSDNHMAGQARTGWQPRLRAARSCPTCESIELPLPCFGYLEIHCDGLVEFGWLSVMGPNRPDTLFSYQAIRELAAVLCWLDALRRFANAGQMEYAVQVALNVTGERVVIRQGPSSNSNPWPRFVGAISHRQSLLPIYPMSDFAEAGRLLTLLEHDLCHAAGIAFNDDDADRYQVTYQ